MVAIWNFASRYSTGWIAMSKITNVRLSNAATGEYDARHFEQLVRSLEQIVLQLNSTNPLVTTEQKSNARGWYEGT